MILQITPDYNLGLIIGIALLVMSAFFGYSGKPWKWVVISATISITSGILLSLDTLIFATALLSLFTGGLATSIGLMIFIYSLVFLLGIGFHYVAWLVGRKLSKNQGESGKA